MKKEKRSEGRLNVKSAEAALLWETTGLSVIHETDRETGKVISVLPGNVSILCICDCVRVCLDTRQCIQETTES